MTHASVFSGIGGPEIAAAMLGWDNLFHCEINPFGRAVLNYWFPNSVSYEDITKNDFSEWRGRVNVLTGGFPCQPFSYAGKRGGAEDDRYLWPYMFRCIDQVRPDWVVCENVAGILTMVEQGEVSEMASQRTLFDEGDGVRRYRLVETFTLQRICDDLEGHGYSVQPVLIPALAVGAPHRRDRVFIVGHRNTSDSDGRADGRNPRENEGESRKERLQERDEVRESDLADKVRPEGKGNTYSADTLRERLEGQDQPGSSEGGKRLYIRRDLAGRSRENVRGTSANTSDEGLQGRHDCNTQGHGQSSDGCTRQPCEVFGRAGTSANTDNGRVPRFNYLEGLCIERKTRKSMSANQSYGCGDIAGLGRWESFPTVSPIHRGNDGLPFNVDDLTLSFSKWRTESLKAYGNAIVPQVMYEIFRTIESVENGTYDTTNGF